MEYVIEMLGIRKEFPGIVANDNVTLQLKRGEIHALLGENGAGKSTLMSVLFGMYQPEAGEIRKNGQVVHIKNPNDANKLGIGMVHQHFKLVQAETIPAVSMEERMAQFQQIMNLIIGRALEVNNEKLSQDISSLVNEKLSGEMELLLQSSDRKEEERFRQLDEVIRSFQKSGQAEAAAARVPFFKRKPFKRSGKSRNASGHPQRSGGLIP